MGSTCPACGYDDSAKMRPVGELWLPTDAVSSNQLGGNGKGASGWKYRKLKRSYLNELEAALAIQPLPKATKKRRVWFVRHYIPPQRAFDTDNLVAGFKPLRDCLTITGLIRNDNNTWVACHYDQEPGDIGGVSVRLEEFI